MKRKLFACFLALTMLTVLTACGGKAANSSASASADTSEAMVPDYTENDSYASYTGSDSGSGGFDETESLPTDAAEQKIIYTGDLNLETTDFDAATRSLSALAEELGGYVENSSIGSSSRGYRWADYTIRIPSGQFQRFFEQVGELAHETWRSTNQENITEVYYDTAGRLKTQQVKLERLQTLLAQAKIWRTSSPSSLPFPKRSGTSKTSPAHCGAMIHRWRSPRSPSICRRSISIPIPKTSRRASVSASAAP